MDRRNCAGIDWWEGVSSSPREEIKQRMRPKGGGCRRSSMPSQDVWRREQPAWRGLMGRAGLHLPGSLAPALGHPGS